MGIFLLSLASAIYSGDTYYEDLTGKIQNLKNVSCDIVNNTYDLEGLNLTTNSTGFTISTQINYRPDNFSVVCLLNGEMIVRSSGGGSHRYYKWDCSDWSICVNHSSSRLCEKKIIYYRNALYDKPDEERYCQTVQKYEETPEESEPQGNLDDNEPEIDTKQNSNIIKGIVYTMFLIIIIATIYAFTRKEKKS